MPDAFRNPPMFNEGDWVHVTGPMADSYLDMIGVVRSVSMVGSIFRYRVEFDDGITDTFFAFELRRAADQSAIA